MRDVVAAATGNEPRSLGKVSTVEKYFYKPWNLGRVGGAIGVDHRNDVARRCCESACKRIPFTLTGLRNHLHIRPRVTRDGHGAVQRETVDKDDLMNIDGDPRKDMRYIASFVEGRNYDRY